MKHQPIPESKPDNYLTQYAVELVIGNWKMLFGSERAKLLIAEGLNEWVAYEKKMELNGYLITDYSIFLIVKSPKEGLNHLLSTFFGSISKLIEHHHHALKLNNINDLESVNSRLLYHRPFEKRNFFNDDLVKLMLGREIKSSYYDLERAYLISNIKHYNYCSAIDYSGAEGPVVITLLKDKNVNINHFTF